MEYSFSSADHVLAARLEAAEAANLMAMCGVAKNSVQAPIFESFAGGVAVFAGIGSPMTHAVGIGLGGAVPEQEMSRMEEFFRNQGSSCLIDLCPLADASVIAFVQNRPYRLIELNNVMVRRIEPDEMFEAASGVRVISEAEIPAWSRMILEAFGEQMAVSEEMVQVMASTLSASQCWSAGESDPVGGAAMGVRDGVALFYGDATLQSARRRGWQTLLIRERLESARKQSCDLAAAAVLPGSVSHRNYERAGFRLIYMRVNLSRDLA